VVVAGGFRDVPDRSSVDVVADFYPVTSFYQRKIGEEKTYRSYEPQTDRITVNGHRLRAVNLSHSVTLVAVAVTLVGHFLSSLGASLTAPRKVNLTTGF
jgi:hypothetical protein